MPDPFASQQFGVRVVNGYPSLYAFAEYSSNWVTQFAQEAARWQRLLNDNLLAIHHIGSTSIPGLAAKPVIDLLPVVSNVDLVDQQTAALQHAGYRTWGECGLPGRRYVTKDHAGYRTHNIHIYPIDHPDIERHLAFCDYLRCHPDACREYGKLKRSVYAQHPEDIDAYNAGKNAWIKQVETTAIAWYRRRVR